MDVRRRWIVILPIVVGTCLLLVAVVLILIASLRGSLFRRAEEQNAGMPFVVVEATPSAEAQPVPTPALPLGCQTIVSSGEAEVAVPLPALLIVDGQSFPVQAVAAEERRWPAPNTPGVATWVCGTVVNYVVQLPSTPENESLVVALETDAPMMLALSNGVQLQFRFSGRQETDAFDPAVLVQSRPRLSMIVAVAEDRWQVATGAYAAEAEVAPGPTLAQVNQSVRLADLEVVVTKGYVVEDAAFLEPGQMAFLVEYTIQNLRSEAVGADEIVQVLQDGAGNEYPASVQASTIGDHGALAGQLAPGQQVQATAGYLVPQTLPGPAVVWTVSLGSGTGLRAQFSIPYESAESVLPGAFEVLVTDVFLSSDQGTLVIEGEIRNAGETPLSIGMGNITLTSSAGLSILRAAAPPLPWTVEAGQTQVIELQYTKPEASAALLTVMGYSFEIKGLQ